MRLMAFFLPKTPFSKNLSSKKIQKFLLPFGDNLLYDKRMIFVKLKRYLLKNHVKSIV